MLGEQLMEIGLATKEERDLIRAWVDQWGVLEPHEVPALADQIYVVRHDGRPVLGCGMMTFEDGKYIRLYGMIKDPSAGFVGKDMKALIDHMCGIAKEMGYTFIQLFAPSEKLARIYEQNGFWAEAKPMIPMRREL
jgi:hypothetical protein